MKKVLLVCTGNLCRSPLATVMLRRQLAEQGLAEQVWVVSAGIYAQAGQPATEMTRAIAAEQGLSLEDHRSLPVTVAMLESADLVIVMEEAQRRFLFYLSMLSLRKIFLLSELSGGRKDIKDPLLGTRLEFKQTARLIDSLLRAGMPRILQELRLEPHGAAGPR